MLLAAGLLQRTDSGVTAVLGILGYNVLYLLLIVLGDNASRWHLPGFWRALRTAATG